jgi:hypothetical protein
MAVQEAEVTRRQLVKTQRKLEDVEYELGKLKQQGSGSQLNSPSQPPPLLCQPADLSAAVPAKRKGPPNLARQSGPVCVASKWSKLPADLSTDEKLSKRSSKMRTRMTVCGTSL